MVYIKINLKLIRNLLPLADLFPPFYLDTKTNEERNLVSLGYELVTYVQWSFPQLSRIKNSMNAILKKPLRVYRLR